MYLTTQSARYTEPMLVQCWTILCNAGLTLNQRWVSVSCLMGTLVCFLSRPRHSAPQMRGCGGGGRVRPQQSHGLLGEAPMTANQASHVLSMLSQLLRCDHIYTFTSKSYFSLLV